YSSLSVGSHHFFADAKDAAGNSDPTGATYSFQVQPPLTTSITSMTPSGSLISSASISFSFTANIAGSTFQCSLDGATKSACTSPMSYSKLADGAHTFAVFASFSGATDTTGASRSWTIDTTPPSVTSVSTSVTSTSMIINWTTSEPATTGLNWGV